MSADTYTRVKGSSGFPPARRSSPLRLAGLLEYAGHRLGGKRAASEGDLLRQIRGYHADLGLGEWADSDLRAALARIKNDIQVKPGGAPESRLAEVFALADESIRRRLGVWRIFDPSFDRQNLEVYFRRAQSGERTTAPDADERIIVDTLRSVLKAGRGRYGWDVLLPAEFYRAVARKDSGNLLQFRATDEQILAGLHLFRGRIVEMYAGEGKTIAVAFPAIMHAVWGRSVHIITANDYLAARDCDLLAPVYRLLGISSDVALEFMDGSERRDAYRKQIVYGTMREFGFDFLRDNLALSRAEQVQPPLQVALIDEVDQALIDEARTPMIIAGAPLVNPQAFNRANQAVAELLSLQAGLFGEYLAQLDNELCDSKADSALLGRALLAQPDNDDLRRWIAANPRAYRRAQAVLYPDGSDYPDEACAADLYYLVDPEKRFVTLTAKGIAFLETRLGDFFAAGGSEPEPGSGSKLGLEPDRRASGLSRKRALTLNMANQVYQLLRAYLLLKRDEDYLVTEDAVVLIDRYTGRPRPDTRYQEGLHPALEAKEAVTVHPDCESLGQISVQGFARRYEKLSGITGTATAAAEEFRRKYSLEVVAIPAARPLLRRDLPCRIYTSEEDKLAAIADEVGFCRRVGRPVLVGVQTVEQSARVSERLSEMGIAHQLLNAVTCHDEAEIVRQAGSFSAVTVATNMAGRGTDIILDADLERRILDRYVLALRHRLDRGSAPVAVRCYTEEEANLLVEVLGERGGLTVARQRRRSWEEISVASLTPPKEVPPPDEGNGACASYLGPEHVVSPPDEGNGPLEFGLGLYVISAEFSESPRVGLQLKGRSGRQGQYGSTRFLLSWDDRALAGPEGRPAGLSACRKIDVGGRVYFEGGAVEKLLHRRQEAAEDEEAVQRSIIQDYAAVSDAHTEAYYRARQQAVATGPLIESPAALTRNPAGRLVELHFPGMDGVDYNQRIAEMVKDLRRWYGVDGSGLPGLALDRLTDALESLLAARLEQRRGKLGDARFMELARLLALQCGDEAWKDYRAGLRSLTVSSRLGNYGHKSAVADYIIHAADGWGRFQGELADLFLSRLLTFPLTRLIEKPAQPESVVELDQEVSLLLTGPELAPSETG